MIDSQAFPVEPWSITERGFSRDDMGKMETVFALSNGHVGLRGNLDEGDPHDLPGTYLSGFFEFMPLPYAEGGYGYPDVGQSIVNVTNGKIIRLLVDDEPFDLRYGRLVHHERVLDMRAGTLERRVEWISPAGKRIRLKTTRMVSFEQRSIAAFMYEVEAVDKPVRLVIQSNLVANEPIPASSEDPRAAAAMAAPLVSDFYINYDLHATLAHHTDRSNLRIVVGMDHSFEGPEDRVLTRSESEPDLARVTFSTELDAGESFRIHKLVAYGWSRTRSMPALRDQVDAALAAAKRTGWDELLIEQREFLYERWDVSDIEIDGDPVLQQAVRFAIFQAMQASTRAERRAVPAKGLTGSGYDGHTFWDMDTFLLPQLTYLLPRAARDALLWRHSTLEIARRRAKELHLDGAAFAWRTIRGEECSGYWPAGTAAFHISADVADAVRRYINATNDENFAMNQGLELLVETARLFASLGHFDDQWIFRLDGVTGPDEYHALVDNNVYTNLMAARNLSSAAALARKYPERALAFGVTADEIALWERAAKHVAIPFDDELGVTMQSDGFTKYREWDFEGTPASEYPLLLHFPYYLLYSSQVIKQADLTMALYLCGEHFTPEQKRKDFEFYESITVRDSSLSASTQGIVAAEVGYLDLAYEYFRETALVDLYDFNGNTDDGLHLAAMSATWLVAVAGFGGMRDHDAETLAFSPCLPDALTRLRFRLIYKGRRIRITVEPTQATYELLSGQEIVVRHDGEPITLTREEKVMRPWHRKTGLGEIRHPYGRSPRDVARSRVSVPTEQLGD